MFSIDLKIDGVLAATFDGVYLDTIMAELDHYVTQFVPPGSLLPNLIQIYIRKQNTRMQNARHRNVRGHTVSAETVVLRSYGENAFITI